MIGKFYTPEEMDYLQIVPAYQEAFKEQPWNEVSKCVDKQPMQRCEGGLSALEIGKQCLTCFARPERDAYELEELQDRFKTLAESRPTAWYLEGTETKIALAAVTWLTTAKALAREKYYDMPQMTDWLTARFQDREFMYLDEIFRDRTVRPNGNLSNLKYIFEGFAECLDNKLLTYRSKQERLIGKTERVFGSSAKVFRTSDMLPDKRNRAFVAVNIAMEAK